MAFTHKDEQSRTKPPQRLSLADMLVSPMLKQQAVARHTLQSLPPSDDGQPPGCCERRLRREDPEVHGQIRTAGTGGHQGLDDDDDDDDDQGHVRTYDNIKQVQSLWTYTDGDECGLGFGCAFDSVPDAGMDRVVLGMASETLARGDGLVYLLRPWCYHVLGTHSLGFA